MEVLFTISLYNFKELYRLACSYEENASLKVLMERGAVFLHKNLKGIVHILWKEGGWTDGEEGELLFEEFTGDLPYHVLKRDDGIVLEDFNVIPPDEWTPKSPPSQQPLITALSGCRGPFSALEVFCDIEDKKV
jgi:hypothetical protein